jgi:MinD-like ATPase involved in chromosome partitioning or flagellar assembly
MVLVDGDLGRGVLANRLGVAPEHGWEDVLRGEQSLADVLVESIHDSLVLLPLAKTDEADLQLFRKFQAGSTLAALRQNFDLVLLDCGPTNGRGLPAIVALAEQKAIDGALLVKDCRNPEPEPLAHARRLVESAGITVIGETENFAPES